MFHTPTLSVMLYQAGTIDEMRELAAQAVSAGVENIYFPDHLIGGGNAEAKTEHPWLAMVPTLMDIAQRHPQIGVGTLVASPSLRPAAQLCVEAATIAHIVGHERFVLSVGAGGADSDQFHLGESLDKDGLSERFRDYAKTLNSYRIGKTSHPLRLASEFKLRLASDSLSTINVVTEFGDAWVTTGGWNSPLEKRIATIDELWDSIRDRFDKPIALSIASSDGITIKSSAKDLEDYATQYQCPVDEIVLPFSPKRS